MCSRLFSFLFIAAWVSVEFIKRSGEPKHLKKAQWKLEKKAYVERRSWKARKETVSLCLPVCRGRRCCFCLSCDAFRLYFQNNVLSPQYFIAFSYARVLIFP